MSPLYKDTGRAGSGPTLVTPFNLISSEKLGFPTKATLSGTERQDLGIFCGAKFTPRRTPLLTGHQPNAAPLSCLRAGNGPNGCRPHESHASRTTGTCGESWGWGAGGSGSFSPPPFRHAAGGAVRGRRSLWSLTVRLALASGGTAHKTLAEKSGQSCGSGDPPAAPRPGPGAAVHDGEALPSSGSRL